MKIIFYSLFILLFFSCEEKTEYHLHTVDIYFKDGKVETVTLDIRQNLHNNLPYIEINNGTLSYIPGISNYDVSIASYVEYFKVK